MITLYLDLGKGLSAFLWKRYTRYVPSCISNLRPILLLTHPDHQATTGLSLPFELFGKPHQATYDFAETLLKTHLKTLGRSVQDELDVYMIGGKSGHVL